MQRKLKNKKGLPKIISFFYFLLFFVYYSSAFASEILFGVGATEADGSRDIAVLIRSTLAINALEGTVDVAPGGVVSGISDAGSPVQFWIERPHLSDIKDKITFSGIIPGGFSGEAALFHIHTKTPAAAFVINKKATRMLLNDGAGTPDQVAVGRAIHLPPQFVLKSGTEDTTPPKPFTPEKAILPSEGGDQPSVVFNAHDDESGIARYEIAYSSVAVDPNDPTLVWKTTTNPASLSAEQDKQFIYVKAIDRAGNMRIVDVSPSNNKRGLLTSQDAEFFAIISIVLALLCGGIFLLKRAKQVLHDVRSGKK